MSIGSSIEWTEATWNPVTGCTKVSHGCKNCYAERMAKRLKGMGVAKYANGFEVVTHDSEVNSPKKWRQPRLIFVNSMSDLFHKSVSDEFIESVFQVMNQTPHHTYQVLTKRPDRVVRLNERLHWTPNIWFGTSIESEKWVARLSALTKTDATVKFLSLEPLLGPLPDIKLELIDWVIVGGESGPRSRKIEASWVREIRDNCIKNEVPFFFKQWGGTFKKRTGRILDDRTWDQMPVIES